jgi:hypothetical protein
MTSLRVLFESRSRSGLRDGDDQSGELPNQGMVVPTCECWGATGRDRAHVPACATGTLALVRYPTVKGSGPRLGKNAGPRHQGKAEPSAEATHEGEGPARKSLTTELGVPLPT